MEISINDGIISFIGSKSGLWKVLSMETKAGHSMEMATNLDIFKGDINPSIKENSNWILRAFISNLRYTSKVEKAELNQKSRGLNRPEFNHAALIPIKKSDEWWALAQDERRKIFEDDSHHIQTTVKYLSVISRQLYHCKDLGEDFDFLTWFEF